MNALLLLLLALALCSPRNMRIHGDSRSGCCGDDRHIDARMIHPLTDHDNTNRPRSIPRSIHDRLPQSRHREKMLRETDYQPTDSTLEALLTPVLEHHKDATKITLNKRRVHTKMTDEATRHYDAHNPDPPYHGWYSLNSFWFLMIMLGFGACALIGIGWSSRTNTRYVIFRQKGELADVEAQPRRKNRNPAGESQKRD